MKWALLAFLLLLGCQRPPPPEKVLAEGGETASVVVFSDPLTGCQYLTLYNHGITPRLSRGGTIICEVPSASSESPLPS